MVTHVAFDIGPLHGHRTGVGESVAATVAALRERDDVEVVPYLTSMRAKVAPPERRYPLPAALAHRVWARPLPRRMEARLGIDRVLRGIDLVHGTNYVVPPARVPRVVTVHDCWFLEHPELANPAVARAGKVLRRAVADGAHVVAPSNATAARVAELLGTTAVTRIHHGPPPPPLDPPARRPERFAELADHPFVVAIGTIERRKNLVRLVEAFGRVAAEHQHVRLVIAGADGDDAAAVTAAIAKLAAAASARIIRPGPVTRPEKDWLLCNARALAYPSLDEGFGFPALEAQQRGTPVVTTAVGSIPEVAGSAALFSSPGDADALAANLFWVISNDRQHAALATRGKANVSRFSWDRAAEQHARLYHRLVDAPGSN